MIKLNFILALTLLNLNAYGQFNKDAKEIKSQRIKSIAFSYNAKCIFDKKGRLIEYIDGDLNEFLDNSDIPHGQINKYTIDSLGNFTQLTVLDYNRCRRSKCQPDTICYSKSSFNGNELDSAFNWEYTDDFGPKTISEIYYASYSKSVRGDTIVEKLYSFWKEVEREPELEIKFTIALTSRKTLYLFIKIPFRYYFSDSVINYLDSTNYGYRTIVKFNRKAKVKNATIVSAP
ncbi:MAG: hypothetical protein GQ574_27020 [Crocinitomix sp.]|nr:hypothetical protein [Crocinitomix sp.]